MVCGRGGTCEHPAGFHQILGSGQVESDSS